MKPFELSPLRNYFHNLICFALINGEIIRTKVYLGGKFVQLAFCIVKVVEEHDGAKSRKKSNEKVELLDKIFQKVVQTPTH